MMIHPGWEFDAALWIDHHGDRVALERDPDEAAHARLGPSSAHRWLRCPASISFYDGTEEVRSSEFAAEGTVAHHVRECCLEQPRRSNVAAYYNEVDPAPAQWHRNLIAAGHIAPGDVDERDIRDVSPDDLRAYTQCHEGVLDAWNSGEVPILLTHPASIGHGMNLQHGGHHLVWFGLSSSLEFYQQLSARLPRSGQKADRVFLYRILTAGTFDE